MLLTVAKSLWRSEEVTIHNAKKRPAVATIWHNFNKQVGISKQPLCFILQAETGVHHSWTTSSSSVWSSTFHGECVITVQWERVLVGGGGLPCYHSDGQHSSRWLRAAIHIPWQSLSLRCRSCRKKHWQNQAHMLLLVFYLPGSPDLLP